MTWLKPILPKRSDQHDFSSFTCGAPEIDGWLQQHALKGQLVSNANVFVCETQGRVLGFFALASGGIERITAPRVLKQNTPGPIPILLLARLGVDESAQKRGIGRLLVQDVVLRVLQISADVGFRALIVHCRDEVARDFYMRNIPSLKLSPTEPLHLHLPLKSLQDFAAAARIPIPSATDP